MSKIVTLANIYKTEVNAVGFKAKDIYALNTEQFAVPLSFVITAEAFDEFCENNNLFLQIEKIISESKTEDTGCYEIIYQKIKSLFDKADFSDEFKDLLMESYDTLTIDTDNLDINKLVDSIEQPFLTMIRSPTYISSTEDNNGIAMSIKGREKLLKAIKSCWLSLFSPESFSYRMKNKLGHNVSTAIIVQRQEPVDVSVISYSEQSHSNPETILVSTFLGQQDYDNKINKDQYFISKNNLSIKSENINTQEFKLEIDTDKKTLTKIFLEKSGAQQKLNDKDVIELARLTKKAEGIIGKPLKMYFALKKGKILLLHTNRILEPAEEPVQDQFQELEVEVKTEAVCETTPEEKTETEEIEKEDPDKEDLGIETHEVEIAEVSIEEDLEFLDEIEGLENKKAFPEEPEKSESETDISENPDTQDVSGVQQEAAEASDDDQKSPEDSNTPQDVQDKQVPKEIEASEVNDLPGELEQSESEPVSVPDPIGELSETESLEEAKPEIAKTVEESEETIFDDESSELDDSIFASFKGIDDVSANENKELFTKASTLAGDAEKLIFERISKLYKDTFSSDPPTFEIAISELAGKVPMKDELLKIHDLNRKMKDSGKDLSPDEIFFVLKTTQKFLEDFK